MKGEQVKHIKKVKPKTADNGSASTEKNESRLIRHARPCIPVDGN